MTNKKNSIRFKRYLDTTDWVPLLINIYIKKMKEYLINKENDKFINQLKLTLKEIDPKR